MVTRYEEDMAYEPLSDDSGTRNEGPPPGGGGRDGRDGADAGTGENWVEIYQAGHGFNNFEVIGWNGSAWALAIADDTGPEALGMVVGATTNKFYLILGGLWNFDNHGLSTGKNYVSGTTAGALTTTAPAPGKRIQPFTFVFNSSWFFINQVGEALP